MPSQSVIDTWIRHQKTTAPSCHCELVKVKQAPSEARLRQHAPSKGKCAWGCTISLLLAFQLNPESCWTVTKGKDHIVVFPVALPRPCCAHTRQSKRPLSVQIVHSRICDNLLSSLFIYLRHLLCYFSNISTIQHWGILYVARVW